MARVTVEDCILKIDNRYELVLLSSYRARELTNGLAAQVPLDNDKNTVISLREIAEDKIDLTELRSKYMTFFKQGFKLASFGMADDEDLDEEVALELADGVFDDEDAADMQIEDEDEMDAVLEEDEQ